MKGCVIMLKINRTSKYMDEGFEIKPMTKEEFKRVNEINNIYNLLEYGITDENEIAILYREVGARYNNQQIPEDIFLEVKSLFESI